MPALNLSCLIISSKSPHSLCSFDFETKEKFTLVRVRLVRGNKPSLAPQHITPPMSCHHNASSYRRCQAIICSTDAKNSMTKIVCSGECATTQSACMCKGIAVDAPSTALVSNRFIDYAPYVWHRLRQSYGIDDEDYLRSIGLAMRMHPYISHASSFVPIRHKVALLTPLRPGIEHKRLHLPDRVPC